MPKSFTSNIQFLSGGGEMGRLIREKDWSKSPLGPPENWPQSLRTTLSILLNSKFPMFLFWGPELICFYNDAFRPSLGVDGKHPNILGGRGEDFWKEIWKDIQPIIDNALKKAEASWNEDMLLPIYRNGKIEDAYWTFSYSPVNDETGKPAGVFVTCSETTEKVVAFKELNDSNKRYLSNISHAPVAMCILRGENLVIDFANDLMLELWEKSEKDVINRPYFDAVPETSEQGLEMMLNNVYKTGESFSANESPVIMMRNGKLETAYLNYVCEALTEDDGSISGIIGTAVDVTKQVISRRKLEEAEQKVRALVENSPFAIAVYTGEQMRVDLANQAIMDIWGKGNDVIGKTYSEILPELAGQSVFEQIKNVYATGIAFHSENTPLELVKNGKKETYYFNYDFTPLYDISGKIYGVMNTGVDLTDLNVAKKKVEESDARFRSTVKQAPIGIIILRGRNYVVEMANDVYMQLVGRDVKGFIGSPLFDSIPEAKESTLHLMDHVMDTGESYHGNEVPVPLKRHDKIEVCNFDFVYHALREDDGTISGIIVTVTEVTEKVQARKKIERNEERLNIVVEASDLGIWELNLKTNEPIYSQRYFEILSGSKEFKQLAHSELIKYLHPEDLEIRSKALADALATGILNYEARLIWDDKSIHWMEGKGKVFYDENGDPEKMIGTIRDITKERNHIQEQKNFAHELEKQVKERTKELNLLNEILQQSEQRYHLMVEEVQDYAILYLSREGIVENWNKGAEKIKGYKAEEIIGKSFENFYTADDRKNHLPQYLLNQAVRHGRYGQEGWRVRKDGTYFWASVVTTAVHNDEGEVIGFSKVTHDLTAKKEADDKIKKYTAELELKNQELEKMNKELQSFAYISSHDLQEPLRKIQTFADQIMEKESDNLSESGKDRFMRMQNAAKRMQALINDLLAYSRTNQEIQLLKTDLNEILENVKDDLKEELQLHNATIEIGTLGEVDLIPFQFHQLMFNLISNSLKFSQKNAPTNIKIEGEIAKGEKFHNNNLRPDIQYCHITFSDNGIGFEQQYSKKIFEVFQRLHGKEVYEGTGIGLAIVKKIVDNHHGLISATGELGKGATFDIYIPVSNQKYSYN